MVHRLRRVAEHRRGDQRGFGRRGRLGGDHPGDRGGGVGVDAAADPVEPGDVHDRGHERDVLGARVRADVSAANRRGHQFRHPHRQRPHRGRRDRRPATAAHRHDAIQAPLVIQPPDDHRKPGRHASHRLVLVLTRPPPVQIAAAGHGDLGPPHIRREGRLTQHPEIHRQHIKPGPLDHLPDVIELGPLRVQRTHQDDRLAHHQASFSACSRQHRAVHRARTTPPHDARQTPRKGPTSRSCRTARQEHRRQGSGGMNRRSASPTSR